MQFHERAISRLVLASVAAVGLVAFAPHASADSSDVPTGSGSAQPKKLASCPLDGPMDYVDSWGDPRSGGRRHEGVDMPDSRGTPVFAVQDGEAEFKRSNLGGNAIWLDTSSGERYYYAHLDAWEGSSRTVKAGEIIGYVGSSGNARGNHLHFEARNGEEAVNPYPLVQSACSTDKADIDELIRFRPRPR